MYEMSSYQIWLSLGSDYHMDIDKVSFIFFSYFVSF